MRVRIVGRGSVGTSVANDLKASGDIAFVVGEDRAERCSQPVVFNGSVLEVPTILSHKGMDEADLIIVAVKNFHLESSLPAIENMVGENTTILPILNGIDAERVLSQRFGEEKVLYGFIQGLSVDRKGNVVNSPSKGTITFGEKDNSISCRVSQISSFFSDNGMNHRVSQSILHDKWCKFMNNTAFNTTTAILGAEYQAVQANESLMAAAEMVFSEVQAVGKTQGVDLTEEDKKSIIAGVRKLGGHGKSSMLEDVLASRPTENDYFCGSISRLGRENGIPTPCCDLLSNLLEARRHVLENC